MSKIDLRLGQLEKRLPLEAPEIRVLLPGPLRPAPPPAAGEWRIVVTLGR